MCRDAGGDGKRGEREKGGMMGREGKGRGEKRAGCGRMVMEGVFGEEDERREKFRMGEDGEDGNVVLYSTYGLYRG